MCMCMCVYVTYTIIIFPSYIGINNLGKEYFHKITELF